MPRQILSLICRPVLSRLGVTINREFHSHLTGVFIISLCSSQQSIVFLNTGSLLNGIQYCLVNGFLSLVVSSLTCVSGMLHKSTLVRVFFTRSGFSSFMRLFFSSVGGFRKWKVKAHLHGLFRRCFLDWYLVAFWNLLKCLQLLFSAWLANLARKWWELIRPCQHLRSYSKGQSVGFYLKIICAVVKLIEFALLMEFEKIFLPCMSRLGISLADLLDMIEHVAPISMMASAWYPLIVRGKLIKLSNGLCFTPTIATVCLLLLWCGNACLFSRLPLLGIPWQLTA